MTAQPIHHDDLHEADVPADTVLWPVQWHLDDCQDCGATVDQPCDNDCPSMVDALIVELAEDDAVAEANREYDAWGWAG